MELFKYKCSVCGQDHTDIPAFGAPAPALYYGIEESERKARCSLGTDDCVVDNEFYFIRALLHIPIHGVSQPFVWIVWVSQSPENFQRFVDTFHQSHRSDLEPTFGWFSSALPGYPDTLGLKSIVHFRDDLQRPLVELEHTNHPLAVEQREGITLDRAAILMHLCLET